MNDFVLHILALLKGATNVTAQYSAVDARAADEHRALAHLAFEKEQV
jgi:hypothetical protein